ncbi:glycosyltransferase family 4 protein [Endozoicomonadaceae bacterium StTr2]
MHILFLTDNFPPEGNAPATRTYEHAIRWVRSGHKVTVITCAPNFPEGKIFSGYKNSWYNKEVIDGINVVRVKTYITANEGFFRRTLDYLSFMISGFIAGLFQKKPDIIVATSPQFFCACAGWLLSAIRRKKFIFEVRDLWPASITAVGAMKKSKIISMLEKVEMFLYRRADRIVTVTHSFKKEMIQRGVDADKIDVVVNGVDLSRYEPTTIKDIELSRKYNLNNKFVVGYLGTHGMAHALDKVALAAHKLKDREDIIFFFAGGGAGRAQLEAVVAEKKLNNVIMLDRQPKEMMPRLWSLCDVSLIHLKNSPLFSTVIPSKLFESMGMGLPVIMSVPEGEATQIVEDNQCGIVVEPENSELLATAIIEMADNPDQLESIKKASIKSAPAYSRDLLAKDMLTSFSKATLSP